MRNRIISFVTGAVGVLVMVAGSPRGWSQDVLTSGRSAPAAGDRLGRTNYGEGVLDLGRYRSTGGVLRSNIGGGGGEDVVRPSRISASGGMSQTARLGQALSMIGSLNSLGRGERDDIVGAVPEAMREWNARRQEPLAILVANQYLDVIGANTAEALARHRAVSTMVPEKAGAYRDLMARGEKAMAAGGVDVSKAHEAVDAFIQASLLTYRNPDVLLSLAHSHFLVSRYSYVSASQYLQETLAILPELPLVQLDPKAFLGGSEVYDNRMARLEEHLRAEPDDPDGLLLRAYFKWFEPDGAAAAAESLRQAYLLAKRPKIIGLAGYPNYDTPGKQLSDSIDIFWKAMLKSGKVSGSLAPTTAPAPTSKPSAPASQPGQPVDEKAATM